MLLEKGAIAFAGGFLCVIHFSKIMREIEGLEK